MDRSEKIIKMQVLAATAIPTTTASGELRDIITGITTASSSPTELTRRMDAIDLALVGNNLPTITSHPASITVDEHALAVFTVTADNATSYVWRFNGEIVAGSGNTYTRLAASVDTAGVVSVEVHGVSASVTSATAVLTVLSYAMRFDGSTQYGSLTSPIVIPITDTFEVYIDVWVDQLIASNRAIMGGDGSTTYGLFSLFIYNGVVNSQIPTETSAKYGSSAALTLGEWNSVGLVWDLTTLSIVINGVYYNISSTGVTGISIHSLAAYGSSLRNNCKLKNFSAKVNGADIRYLPLTNKIQGGTQQATIGAGAATIIGYNSSMFVAD